MLFLSRASASSCNNNNLKNGSSISPCSPKQRWDACLPIMEVSFPTAVIVVFFLAIVCFWNSANGEFVFDDSEAVVNNKDLHPETPVKDLFTHDFWGGKVRTNTSHKSYRPLTILTFRWNYYLSGGLHAKGFHITNIFLHGLVCVLALCSFSLLFGDSYESVTPFSKAAFLAGLIFSVHPIHTESVAATVGRADLLSALFFFAAFLVYAKACHHENVSAPQGSFSLGLMLISLCLSAASMLCKEQGITVIGLCSMYDIFVICKVCPMNLLAGVFKQNSSCNNNLYSSADFKCKNKEVAEWVKFCIFRHLILLFSTALMLVVRLQLMGTMPPVFQKVDNPASFSNYFWVRVINYNYVYSLNAWLLIHPWWLCFDWSMGCIPLIQTILDPRILAPIIFWIVLGMLIKKCFTAPSKRMRRSLIMGLSLLTIPFLPATNLFFRVGFVIAERVLYLPSAGFSILVVLGLWKICQYAFLRKIMQFAVFMLILIFIGKCVQRSEEWKTEESLFHSGARVCPLNAKVHYNIAKTFGDAGRVYEAMQKYREALRLNPNYDQAMNNLANILRERGELFEAEKLLMKAVKLRPNFAAAWMNLGIVQASLNKTELAEKSYLTALKHRRHYPDCYYNLGNLFLEQKRHQEALNAWKNAVHLRPSHIQSWNNMVIMLDTIEDYITAENVALEGLTVLDEPSLHFNLANILGKLKKYDMSEYHFRRAISSEPDKTIYYANLGVLYHRWEKWDKAIEAYSEALRMNPSMVNIQGYLQTVQHKAARSSKK